MPGWVTPRPLVMAIAMALSAGSMVVHNLYELPSAIVDLENSGPLLVAGGLAVTYGLSPDSRAAAFAILTWAALNLVVGAVVTVLPLPILPFAPEQSVTHYLVHAVYGLGQVPLLGVSLAAVLSPRAETKT